MSSRLSDTLQAAVTKAATFTGTAITVPADARSATVTLDVTSAERDSTDETYDVYITTSDGVSSWDVVHFPQIATTGAKRYTARVLCDRLAEVTTAGPGVAAEPSATLKTDTAGSGAGIKTLTAGTVRHGPLGLTLNHTLVVAGTVVTGITYSLTVTYGR